MVKVIPKALVTASLIALSVGLLFFRTEGSLVVFGLVLLVIAWFIERLTLKRYQPSDVEFYESDRGELRFPCSSSLVVTDNWKLTDSANIGIFDGDYIVEIIRVRRAKLVLIDAVRLFRSQTLGKVSSVDKRTIYVDTGRLLFLVDMHANEDFLRKNSLEESKYSASLSAEEPLFFWLRGDDQTVVGFVVGSGGGNSDCAITFSTVNGIVTEAIFCFGT